MVVKSVDEQPSAARQPKAASRRVGVRVPVDAASRRVNERPTASLRSGEATRRDAASTVARYKTRTPLSTYFLHLFSIVPLLALATAHASPVATSAISARAYVQDGLVAQWDGIENAGYGQHDDAATYPRELVSDISQTLSGTIAAGSDYFSLGSGYLKFKLASALTAINAGSASVEMRVQKDGTMVNNGGLVALGNATRGFWAWQSSSYLFSAYSYHSKATGEYVAANENADSAKTFSFLLGSTTAESWYAVDGVRKAGLTRHTTDCATDDDCFIGTIGYTYVDTKANARMYSVRIYNRMLSTLELGRNNAIDRMRFEGATSNETGYAWIDGALHSRISFAASDGGKVAALRGGTAVDADGELWAPLGDVGSVTLVAVPDVGHTFVRWTGDVGEADVFSTTLTPPAGVVNVTAVFAPYVRLKSLVATGSQWVHSGLTPGCTDRIALRARFVDKTGDQCLWCARGTSSTANTITAYLLGASTRTMRFDRRDYVWNSSGYEPLSVRDVTIAIDGSTLEATADGNLVQTMRSNSFTPGSPLALFAAHTAGTALSESSTMSNFARFRFYSLRVTSSAGDERGRFVPVQDPSAADGAAKQFGLLDLVTGSFRPNYGSAPFVPGEPEVGTNGSLTVAYEADGAATASPCAGTTELAPGATLGCSAADVTDATAGTRTLVTGYTLETYDRATGTWSTPVFHEGTSYAHTQVGIAATRLTWKWRRQVRITATSVTRGSASAPGTVSLAGDAPSASPSAWFDLGTNVTAVAAAQNDCVFSRWEGNVRDDKWMEGATVDVRADRPRDLVARFNSPDEILTLVQVGKNYYISNEVSRCVMKVTVSSTNLTLTAFVTNGTEHVVDLTLPIRSADRTKAYRITGSYGDGNVLCRNQSELEYHLPDTLTYLPNYGAFGTKIGVVRIPRFLTSLQSRFFQGSAATNIYGGDLFPDTVTTISGAALYSLGAKGPLRLSNPAITTIPNEFFRSSLVTNVDLTGTSIAKISGGSAIFANSARLVDITWPETMESFVNSSVSSGSDSYTRYVRFRGVPPTVTTSNPFGGCAYLAYYAPKWSASWEAADEREGCAVSNMTAATCKTFAAGHPGEPMPHRTIRFGGVSRYDIPLTWWYPNEPPVYTDLTLTEALGYDAKAAAFAEYDTALFDGTTYTWCGEQVQFAWTAPQGYEAVIEVPVAAGTARALKHTKYRLHQLCLGTSPNGRAPTAWTLYGKTLDSDDWTLIDQVTMTSSSASHWAYMDAAEFTETAPAYGSCAVTFEIPSARQMCYKAFKFVPSASYNTEHGITDETPFGLMELEFVGQLTTPKPEIGSCGVERSQWNVIDFTGTVAGLGEDPPRGVAAGAAWGWFEVSTNADFSEIASVSPVRSVTAHVAQTYAVSNLTGNTAYYARFTVSNDLEAVTTEVLDGGASTLSAPFTYDRPMCETDEDGRTTVKVDVTGYYAASPGAIAFYCGTTPSGPWTQEGAAQTLFATGVVTFVVSTPVEGDSPCVKVVISADGATSETVVGRTPFWIANAETHATMISNSVYDIAFSVTDYDSSGLNFTLGTALTTERTSYDLTPPLVAPSGVRLYLTSTGTGFRENNHIEELLLPDSIVVMPAKSFYACGRLRKVRFPACLTTIGNNCFESCTSLSDVPSFLPDSVTSVGEYAFINCSSLPELTIPATLASLHCYQFNGCSGLKLIRFAERNGASFAFGNFVFGGCTSLTNIVPRFFPPEVTVSTRSFKGCSSLVGDVVIEKKGTYALSTGSFYNCAKITSLDFSGCDNVSFVYDQEATFEGCSSLTNIVFPVGFTSFGTDKAHFADWGSSKLKRVAFRGFPPKLGTANPISTSGDYFFDILTTGRRTRQWLDYIGTNAAWTATMTSAEREAWAAAHPGERVPRQKFNLGGVTGLHPIRLPAPKGLCVIIR